MAILFGVVEFTFLVHLIADFVLCRVMAKRINSKHYVNSSSTGLAQLGF